MVATDFPQMSPKLPAKMPARMPARMDDAIAAAAAWLAAGHKVALGTVVASWGSAPRGPGSQMAVRGDGIFAGSVSAGCVENEVIAAALESLKDGKPRNLELGVSDDMAWSAGLACGGRIGILVEAADAALLDGLLADRSRAVVRALDLKGQYRFIDPSTDKSAANAARADKSGIGDDGWFLEVHNPPLELVIVGAVHIAQTLWPMAALANYRVRIIDPRTGWANEARFAGAALVHEWPEAALAAQPLGARSALVALAHDP
jgi:xanthine dehydrogenase accessory factor